MHHADPDLLSRWGDCEVVRSSSLRTENNPSKHLEDPNGCKEPSMSMQLQHSINEHETCWRSGIRGGKWWYTSRLTYSYDGIIRFAKNQLVLGTREGVVFSAFMHHLALFYLCPPAHWGTTPAYISYRSYKSFKSRYSPSYIPVIQCIYIYIIYGDKKIQSVWKSFPPPPRKEKTCKKIYNYFCNPSSLLKPTNSTLYLMNDGKRFMRMAAIWDLLINVILAGTSLVSGLLNFIIHVDSVK